MTTRLPYPLPNGYDPSGPFSNPGATNPLPSAGNLPTACWFGPSTPIQWSDISGTDPNVQLRGTWASPIFDMRPDLRHMTQNGYGSHAGSMSGVPMWNPSASLWVQFENPRDADGVKGRNLSGLQILSQEEVHVSDPQSLRTISDPEDITAQFSTMGDSSIQSWQPPGVRYYRLRLTFHMKKNFQAPEPNASNAPIFNLVPVMY